jgi:hypothetical protein
LHHEPIWARLDTIKARVPSMVLVTTGQHRGADKIAAAWAAHNGVHTILFRLNHRSGGKAGFDRNKGLINLQPVEAIICEGSFLQVDFAKLCRGHGVPVTIMRNADFSGEAPPWRVDPEAPRWTVGAGLVAREGGAGGALRACGAIWPCGPAHKPACFRRQLAATLSAWTRGGELCVFPFWRGSRACLKDQRCPQFCRKRQNRHPHCPLARRLRRPGPRPLSHAALIPSNRQETIMNHSIIAEFTAKIDAACEEAHRGCGLSDVLFTARFQEACEGLLASVPDEHRAEALAIAEAQGLTRQ